MWLTGGRSSAKLAIDLTLVGLSPLLALTLRDNFAPSVAKLGDLFVYTLVCVFCATVVFGVLRLHRRLWRYVSLGDVLQIIAAASVTILLALLATFVLNRLEGIARSLPVIQWFLLITLMTGTRIAVRLLGEWRSGQRVKFNNAVDRQTHALVVGVTEITELYIRAAAEAGKNHFTIVGILTHEPQLRGRSLRSHKVLGKPKDIQRVINELSVHGVSVDRVVVTQPFSKLSQKAREELGALETCSSIKVDWLIESLGFHDHGRENESSLSERVSKEVQASPSCTDEEDQHLLSRNYYRYKRMFDIIAAACLIVALAPLLGLAALAVALDVGLPVVFWQQRPGRHGHPFRLFKLRTMRPAHDADGNRIPDELRSSSIGRFLRRTWLDELPQLYNILVGEMSFVGPRPLLPVDQPNKFSRLLLRPGLTGWAQINGGRDISPEDKAALDIWYLKNASFWLDMKILLLTLKAMVRGPRAQLEGEEMGPILEPNRATDRS